MSKLKKLIMMANQIDDRPSLPKEYVQLEYLESLPNPTYGRCIIDTGINSSNTRVIMKAQGTVCNNSYMSPIGYWYDYSGCGIFCYNDTKGWALNSVDNSYTNIPYANVVDIDVVFRTDPVNSALGTINNVPVDYTRSNKQGISTLKLFHNVGLLTDYSNRNYGFIGKIFYCRIEDADSGIVLGEYIPALRIADLKPGMYDLVTGQFFVNQGTGEFVFPDIPDTQKPYLCFEAVEDDFQVKYSINPCEYSIDDRKTWNELPADTLTPVISAGSKIYFRGRGVKSTAYPYSRGTFSTTKPFNISGNMLSMVHGSDFLTGTPDSYTYTYMFRNNKNIVSISDDFLNIKFGYRGFMNLFMDSSISKAILYNYQDSQQYWGTFVNSQLKDVEIKFKTQTSMLQVFENTQIESVVFPMTNIGNQGLAFTCRDCKSLKYATILAKSLTSVDSIKQCFYKCSSLSNLTFLVTTPLAKSNALDWLTGVAEEGTIILNKNITWNPEDYRNGNIDNIEGSATLGETILWGIPANWAVKYCDPDNIDDVRDSKDDFCPQEINTILQSIITEEELDNMDSLLQQISQSQEDVSSINTQLENIINT